MNNLWEGLELGRRAVHTSGVVLPLAYVSGLIGWGDLGVLLAVGAITVTVLEFCRLSLGFTHTLYDRLTRPYEEESVAGYALYMFGMAGAWLLFPPTVAVAGMLMLALGDPVSGMLSDATAEETKQLSVLTVMFTTSLVVALPVTIPALGGLLGVGVAAAGALGATVSDGTNLTLRGRFIDDNLTIPLASSLCMAAVLLVV